MYRSDVEAVKKSIPRGRRKLAAVIRDAGDVIKIDNVVSTLSVDRPDAAKLLSRWAGQGWLRRVGPGAYVPVQLDSLESDQVLDDPWILVPVLYGPAYIGGWSAAEHWGLTEQFVSQDSCHDPADSAHKAPNTPWGPFPIAPYAGTEILRHASSLARAIKNSDF